jgi:hypothetical protein
MSPCRSAALVVIALLGPGVVLLPGAGCPAAEGKNSSPRIAATEALLRVLDEEIPTKDLPDNFFLLLEYLTDRRHLPFLVDFKSFTKDVQAVRDGELPPPQLKLQPLPARMTIRAVLHLAVDRFDSEATFLVRQGRVEVTTRKAASFANLLTQTFAVSFDRQPLELVLDELSDLTGATIVSDDRARDALRTPVSARFRNDVPLLEALRMLTASAGLTLVELGCKQGAPRALFVTTPEYARALAR